MTLTPVIVLFNPAAARLLGLARAEVQGKLFADVFLNLKGLEDFNDTVLAAVYDNAVGSRSTVSLRIGGGHRAITRRDDVLPDRLQGRRNPQNRHRRRV